MSTFSHRNCKESFSVRNPQRIETLDRTESIHNVRALERSLAHTGSPLCSYISFGPCVYYTIVHTHRKGRSPFSWRVSLEYVLYAELKSIERVRTDAFFNGPRFLGSGSLRGQGRKRISLFGWGTSRNLILSHECSRSRKEGMSMMHISGLEFGDVI